MIRNIVTLPIILMMKLGELTELLLVRRNVWEDTDLCSSKYITKSRVEVEVEKGGAQLSKQAALVARG